MGWSVGWHSAVVQSVVGVSAMMWDAAKCSGVGATLRQPFGRAGLNSTMCQCCHPPSALGLGPGLCLPLLQRVKLPLSDSSLEG